MSDSIVPKRESADVAIAPSSFSFILGFMLILQFSWPTNKEARQYASNASTPSCAIPPVLLVGFGKGEGGKAVPHPSIHF